MKPMFILFTAFRYLKARRKSKGFMSSLLSIIGVTLGLVVLTTVIAVMNGFQFNYINNLLEISSYHVQIDSPEGKPLPPDSLARMAALPGITSIVPFREFLAIFDRISERSQTMFGTVRAVDVDASLKDESFIRHLYGEKYASDELDAMKADFDIRPDGTVAVGYLLAAYLGIQKGSEIILSSIDQIPLSSGGTDAADVSSRRLRVSSVFKSGYRDIDEYYLFISRDNSGAFFPAGRPYPLQYGIKLSDRFNDLAAANRIRALPGLAGFQVKTWRDFNKSYFGALLMEKVAMLFLVGLIFIVVGFGIFNSLRRIVYEKYEDIAVLKAIGATPGTIRAIFVIEGFLIGLIGGVIGVFTGLFLATHIDGLFTFIFDVINGALRLAEQAAGNFQPLYLDQVESPFSPRIFYFKSVPSVVIPEEVVFMFLFAVLSAVGAAFLASKKISDVTPAEVLRYE
jgi:lipoprotein-releasing system permease protein